MFRTEDLKEKGHEFLNNFESLNRLKRNEMKQFSSINNSLPIENNWNEKFVGHSKRKTLTKENLKKKLAMTFNKGQNQRQGSEKNIYLSSKKKEIMGKNKKDSEMFSSHVLNEIKKRADIGYLEHKKLQRDDTGICP